MHCCSFSSPYSNMLQPHYWSYHHTTTHCSSFCSRTTSHYLLFCSNSTMHYLSPDLSLKPVLSHCCLRGLHTTMPGCCFLFPLQMHYCSFLSLYSSTLQRHC